MFCLFFLSNQYYYVLMSFDVICQYVLLLQCILFQTTGAVYSGGSYVNIDYLWPQLMIENPLPS